VRKLTRAFLWQTKSVPKNLLSLLADGNTHSGRVLGERLGISRAAVCKQIKKLNDLGLEVVSAKGMGYRLCRPLEMICADAIAENLEPQVKNLISNIDVRWSVNSTNSQCLSYLKDKPGMGYICLAEHQSAGRGRRGRQWVSPLAGNLYLSIVWQFTSGAEALDGLSLAVAIVVADVLREEYLLEGVKIKWPNDIFFEGKKIGGILIEIIGEAGGPCFVVIGIGLNVTISRISGSEITQSWTDLYSATGKPVSRNQLAASVLNRLVPLLQIYECVGFAASHGSWASYDAFIGKNVVLQQGVSGFLEGIARGVSNSGELLLEINGIRRKFKSGEVSLRSV
jgi:BirA family transcriptional regulator, biotin operon repressor / biotin---[acetyl-CoA-carboxylase] ligase